MEGERCGVKRLDQQDIKRANLHLIYNTISGNQGVSRAQLAAMLGLSKTTVSSLVDELLQDGFVCGTGTKESAGSGRKATGLAIDASHNAVAVIHWHRAKLECALVDTNLRVVHTAEQLLQPDRDIAEEVGDAYRRLLAAAKARRLLGLLLIVPGIVDSRQKAIYSTVLPAEPGNTILQSIRAKLPDVSLGVFNDTACYAVAEETLGNVETGRYTLININRGVGAALVMDGKILRGAGGMATQFGHYSIDPHGPLCNCGNRGCLERLVGEAALPDRARACGVGDSFAGLDAITFLDVGRLAAAGDKGALKLAETLAGELAYALGNLIALYNPELVIFGGRSIQLGPLFLQLLRQRLDEQGFAYFVHSTELRFSRLQDTAAIQGAAAYYLGQHFDFSRGCTGELYLT